MKENIGTKVVAAGFALVGVLGTLLGTGLFLFGIAVVSLGLDKPQFAFDSSVTLVNPGTVFYSVLIGIAVILFSVPAFLISKGLRKLQRRAYEAALAISGIFIFSALIVLLQGFYQSTAVMIISIISLLSLVADVLLFTNRQLFADHRTIPANEVGAVETLNDIASDNTL